MKQFIQRSTPLLVAAALLAGGCATLRPPGEYRESPEEMKDEAALESRAAAHAHYAAAVIHEMNDERNEALAEYFKAAVCDLDNETLTLEVSRRLLLAGQNERALELLLAATARPNAPGPVFARLGLVYSQLGKVSEATQASRTAIKRSPSSLAGYQTLFRLQLQSSKPADAMSVLDAAAKQHDVDAEFLTGLGELYANLRLQVPSRRAEIEPKAIAVLERAAQLDPTNALLQIRLADGFYAMGKPDKAAVLYEQSLIQLEDFPIMRDTVRAKLADIYLRANNTKQAADKLEDLVREDPSNGQAYYFLGSIAYDQKRWTNAAENLEKAVLFNPGLEQAYYDLAASYLGAGQGTHALDALEKARARFAQNFLMEYLFGIAFTQSKAYTEAVQHFTSAEILARAGDTNRLNENFYFQYGVASERKGDYPLAEQCFLKSIDRSPDFAEALNYLGYMWADRGENLERARDLIERALKVEPKSAAYLDSLGWVFYKLGQFKPALEYILKAVDLSEEPDAELFAHLGDVYSALKEPDKAREAWQKSIAIEPNETLQKKLVDPAAK